MTLKDQTLTLQDRMLTYFDLKIKIMTLKDRILTLKDRVLTYFDLRIKILTLRDRISTYFVLKRQTFDIF